MISTGNDIVSLNTINATRTKQYKFYSKILSDSENPLYNEFGLAGIPFENFVWLLWSIKESAYKFLQRNDPALIFTPVKFVVESISLPLNYSAPDFDTEKIEETGFDEKAFIKAVVNFGAYTLFSRSLMYKQFIHSVISNDKSFEGTCWGVKSIDDKSNKSQSNEVRSFLSDRLTHIYGPSDFTITKTPRGCPILFKGDKQLAMPVSLSHHEYLVAYSFQKDT